MGVDVTGLRALLLCKKLYAPNLARSVMLGRHEVQFIDKEFDFFAGRSETPVEYDPDAMALGTFCEPLLRAFGAETIDSIDAADYEGASIVSDFNLPLSPDLKSRYSFYADFGSMEHVFNIPQVVVNVNHLLETGGTALMVTNVNGFAGHGFYQFAPEFFYSIFSAGNGFGSTKVFLVDTRHQKRWRLLKEPSALRGRHNIPPDRQFFCVCFTRKIADAERASGQQSDYASDAWLSMDHKHISAFGRTPLSRMRTRVSPFVFSYFRQIYYGWKSRIASRAECTWIDPEATSTI